MSISFDRIAERYDQTRGFPSGVAADVAAGLAHEAGLVPGMRMLEIGVGTGRIAVPVATHVFGLHYVGADISSAMMRQLRAKLKPATSIDLLQSDATRLPFSNSSFEVALEVQVLHLVSSVEQAIEELWRVLRPGGLFLRGYTDYDEDSDFIELRYHRWHQIVDELSDKPLYASDSRSKIKETITPIFGLVRTVALVEWYEHSTPRSIIDSLASRTTSDTWRVPEPIFAEAIRRTTAWARERFGDLDQPLERRASFELEVYER